MRLSAMRPGDVFSALSTRIFSEAAVALSATYGLSVLLGALPGGLALFIDSRS